MSGQNKQYRAQTTTVPMVLAVGSLASAARTVSGVLSQAEWFGVSEPEFREILRQLGLPERAVEDPTFLLSFDQELALIEALLSNARLNNSLSAFVVQQQDLHDITMFGIIGLAMRHAPTLLSVLKVGFDFPQLLWGHSRMQVTSDSNALSITFSIDRHRTTNNELIEYTILLDLISFYTFINQSMGPESQVTEIHLPFKTPIDFDVVQSEIDCPIHYEMPTAQLILPPNCQNTVTAQARPIAYQQCVSVCTELSRLRPIETAFSDQALRWLWAYSPPLTRTDLAKQLNVSERSLARRLRAEGTSYLKLFAEVQEERARNLLRTSTLTIAEIGYQLGYTDPAAFTRAFQGWTGETPSRWRVNQGRV